MKHNKKKSAHHWGIATSGRYDLKVIKSTSRYSLVISENTLAVDELMFATREDARKFLKGYRELIREHVCGGKIVPGRRRDNNREVTNKKK